MLSVVPPPPPPPLLPPPHPVMPPTTQASNSRLAHKTTRRFCAGTRVRPSRNTASNANVEAKIGPVLNAGVSNGADGGCANAAMVVVFAVQNAPTPVVSLNATGAQGTEAMVVVPFLNVTVPVGP